MESFRNTPQQEQSRVCCESTYLETGNGGLRFGKYQILEDTFRERGGGGTAYMCHTYQSGL